MNLTADDIKLGSFLLDTLTVGMYENPMHCLREYVQNAFDGIADAIGEGLLGPNDGCVEVSIAGPARRPNLKVFDNGTGVPAAQVVDRLVSVGNSSKNPQKHAGFRGIGRLAGLAYCTELRFTTSASGEKLSTVVSFDCPKARDLIRAGARPMPLQEIIVQCVTISTEKAAAAEHFMRVELIGLTGLGEEFVEPQRLDDYLSQYAPVDFASSFPFKRQIEAFAAQANASIPHAKLELSVRRETKDIRKAYSNTVPVKDESSKLERVELLGGQDLGWFGWFGVSDFLGEIADPRIAGIRLRQKNIQVGDASLMEAIAHNMPGRSNRRLMRWIIGEIHIVNPQVVPNARRDGFEDNAAWRSIRKDLEGVIAKLTKAVRQASDRRSDLKKVEGVIKDARTTIKDAGGSIGRDVRDAVDSQLDAQLQAIARKLEKGLDPERANTLVSEIKELRERLNRMRLEPIAATSPTLKRVLAVVESVLVDEVSPKAKARRILSRIRKELTALQPPARKSPAKKVVRKRVSQTR